MSIKKMKLPYSLEIFEPNISKETFEYHYNKHYTTYINKLNALISGTELENASLIEIVNKSSGNIFNNAAQVWNHEFYWLSISTSNTDKEKNVFFKKSNITHDKLKDMFIKSATSLFGSGWCWLVKDKENKIEFINTSNADLPISIMVNSNHLK